LATAPGET